MEILSRNLINPDVTNGENSFAKLQNLLLDYVSCLFKITFNHNCINGGRRWLSWKVAGSIPDGVIEIFHLHNPSGHTMALRSTQPLTEISNK